MIALTPQFASLLVAVTGSMVGAVPHPRQDVRGSERRFVVDVDIPEMANLHVRPRVFTPRHEKHYQVQNIEKPADAKAVYIQPPSRPATKKESKARVALAPLFDPTANIAQRGLEEPIDEPDQNEQLHAEGADVALAEQAVGLFKAHETAVQKRQVYHIDAKYGPGLIITHASSDKVQQISRALAVHTLNRRGLLDPLLPILGSIPGIGGIINIIAGTFNDVLKGLPIIGPILGGLILSPHSSASVQGITDGSGSSNDFFLDASSSRNASTIYMVDSGHPSPFAIASQSNGTNTTSERIVSLQMAFVNVTSGQVQAYCATFNDADQGPVGLAAKPCLTDGVTNVPHPSQTFGYNPANQAVRPMWDEGTGNKKRDYIVQASSGEDDVEKMDAGNEKESVVLVFKAFEDKAMNGTESSGQSAKDTVGTDGSEEAPTSPAPAAAMDDPGVPVFVAGVAPAA